MHIKKPITIQDAYNSIYNKQYINEAKISVEFEDGTQHNIDLEDIYAKKVLGFTASSKHRLQERIEQWLKVGNWSDEGIRQAVPQINRFLMEIFDMQSPRVVEDISNEIRELISLIKSGAYAPMEPFLVAAASSNTPDDLLELLQLPKEFKYLNNLELKNRLFSLDFAEGTIGVGPGEVALTIYTEAYNPSKGDLFINNIGEIEFKSNEGRVGNGAEASEVMKKYILDATSKETLDAERQEIFNEIKDSIAAAKDSLDFFKSLYTTPSAKSSIGYKVLDAVLSLPNLKNLDNSPLYKRMRTQAEASASIAKTLVSIENLSDETDINELEIFLQNIATSIQNYYNQKAAGDTSRFNLFWSNPDRDPKILYEYLDKKYQNNKASRAIVDFYRDKLQMSQLVAATMIANYQLKEGFKYIVFANTKTLNSAAAVIIGEFTADYNSNLSKIMEKSHLFKVAANVERGSGFQVTVAS